jgi:SOS-response transcriptional repressor LexA
MPSTHLLRNISDKFSKKISSDIKEDFKAIFKTASIELAGERKQLIMDKYGGKTRKSQLPVKYWMRASKMPCK